MIFLLLFLLITGIGTWIGFKVGHAYGVFAGKKAVLDKAHEMLQGMSVGGRATAVRNDEAGRLLVDVEFRDISAVPKRKVRGDG